MIYFNIVCIAVSAFLAGMFDSLPVRLLNGAAALFNVAVVAAHIARLSA